MAVEHEHIYPDYLPLPLVSGFGYKLKNNIINSSFGYGDHRAKLRYDVAEYQATLKFAYNKEQLQRFEYWYNYFLNKGINWFTIDLEMKSLKDSNVLCRITSTHKVSVISDNLYNVSFSVEIKNIKEKTEEDIIYSKDILSINNDTKLFNKDDYIEAVGRIFGFPVP